MLNIQRLLGLVAVSIMSVLSLPLYAQEDVASGKLEELSFDKRLDSYEYWPMATVVRSKDDHKFIQIFGKQKNAKTGFAPIMTIKVAPNGGIVAVAEHFSAPRPGLDKTISSQIYSAIDKGDGLPKFSVVKMNENQTQAVKEFYSPLEDDSSVSKEEGLEDVFRLLGMREKCLSCPHNSLAQFVETQGFTQGAKINETALTKPLPFESDVELNIRHGKLDLQLKTQTEKGDTADQSNVSPNENSKNISEESVDYRGDKGR